MHSPAPYGRFFYGKGRPSNEDYAAGELLMRRLRNLASTSDLANLKLTRDLPSGGTAVAVMAGGTVRLVMFGPDIPVDDILLSEGLAETDVPMLFSGRVVRGLTTAREEGRQIELVLTEKCRQRLAGYKSDKQAPGRVTLQRFACNIPPHLGIFGAMSPLKDNMTQYHQIRPTWWTGAMSTVIQIVGGYGRQDFESLPEHEIERAKFKVPEKVMQKISLQLNNTRLPGYTGKPPETGEFQYNFQFNETDGVAFSPSGSPWLVRISKSGIYAMPLPLIPATTTEAFREYIDEIADNEIQWILDRFGGMPSGESFPRSTAGFEAWRRAGVIQKIGVAADFYDYEMFGSAMGWAFNESGTEALNTAHGNEADLPIAVAYKIRLAMANLDDHGFMPLQEEYAEHETAANEYLSGLIQSIDPYSDKARAIRYKIRRVPVSDILARANEGGGESDVDYWDRLELDPLAQCSAQCTRVSKGVIFPKVLPEVKIPEPIMEGCISMAHGYTIEEYPEEYPKCDTIINGFYLGDQLKVIRYFRDERKIPKEEESDFEDCMAVGQWQKITYHNAPRIHGSVYTTDFDERKEISEDYTVTNVKSVDLGYTGASLHQLVSLFSFVFSVWRRRYFGKTTNTKRHRGGNRSTYCYTPFMTRAGYVFGIKDTSPSVEEKETAVKDFVSDPNSYYAWSYDWYARWWWAGQEPWFNWAMMPHETSPPNPFLVAHHYKTSGGACADWADEGPWIDDLPADFTSYFRTKDSWHEEYGEVWGGGIRATAKRPYFRTYTITKPAVPETEHKNWFNFDGRPQKLSEKEVSYMKFTITPDENMNTLQEDCTSNKAGEAKYTTLSDTGGDGSGRKVIGHTVIADNKTAHHFIGVINE